MRSTIAPLLSLLSCVAAVTLGPVVDLGYAKYQSERNASLGVDIYHGIRYAAAPVGELRFAAPVPIESKNNYSSTTPLNATAAGPQCVQGYPAWNGSPGFQAAISAVHFASAGSSPPSSEDCLLLDVIVPSKPASSNLPVIVQIHGGGFTQGNTASSDGRYFTSHAQGSLIYVQIQYRLGAYGFMNSAEMRDSGDATANAGLLDQRAALEWVQRNIRPFGGDPSKVTIWGGSAGGGSVTAQLQLYGGVASPPFRAAIAEYPWWQPFKNSSILEAQYQQLLTASSCNNLACLRGLSFGALANATQKTYSIGYNASLYGYGDFYYGPSVDGAIMQGLPSDEFAASRFSKVPILVDHDAFEGVLFTNLSVADQAAATSDLQTVWGSAKPAFFTRAYQLYPESDFTGSFFNATYFQDPTYQAIAQAQPEIGPGSPTRSTVFRLSQMFGDFIIACPTYYIGSAAASAGLPIWKLVFATGTQMHGATGPYLLSPPGATDNATLANWMQDYFAAFAVNLDPNSPLGYANATANGTRPSWPQYLADSGDFTVLQVNDTNAGAGPDPDASDRCDFFDSHGLVVRN